MPQETFNRSSRHEDLGCVPGQSIYGLWMLDALLPRASWALSAADSGR